ncbi:MAG: hypothetical protein E6Q97_12750 [Desulfurellales bacterium]|nr:MAG: hypothetical protein E6Q97_12750 [Desulfurellales bacterium]
MTKTAQTWSYRVRRTTDAEMPGWALFEIVEVYADDGDETEPHSLLEAGAPFSDESVEGLRADLVRMLAACDKPIIEVEL